MDKKQLEILTNIIGGVESGGQVYGQRRYEAYARNRQKEFSDVRKNRTRRIASMHH